MHYHAFIFKQYKCNNELITDVFLLVTMMRSFFSSQFKSLFPAQIGQLVFKGMKRLNRIQSIVFETAYNTNENLLICAPTGAGKTNIAMLTVLHEIRQHLQPGGVIKKDEFKVHTCPPHTHTEPEMHRHAHTYMNALAGSDTFTNTSTFIQKNIYVHRHLHADVQTLIYTHIQSNTYQPYLGKSIDFQGFCEALLWAGSYLLTSAPNYQKPIYFSLYLVYLSFDIYYIFNSILN